MDNKFFTFIKPYLSYIDSGSFFRQPFGWLYMLMAGVNLLIPFYIFYAAVDNHVFQLGAKAIFLFLLIWLVVVFASWVSFQLWWDRKSKVTAVAGAGDEFTATPVFAHFIQTMGEWMGTWIGIVGFLVALLTTIILGESDRSFLGQIGLPFMESGAAFIIMMPVYGFLIVVVARFFAEQCRALSAIANNTKKR
ncbi:hypothetical protein FACS189430_09590 [Bacteroidia bacterium]|nr:hypothetical protein FACS189430_09590 [Bacteroidia bacterium]